MIDPSRLLLTLKVPPSHQTSLFETADIYNKHAFIDAVEEHSDVDVIELTHPKKQTLDINDKDSFAVAVYV